jgi:predicted alpha/beta hydrolase family esterase
MKPRVLTVPGLGNSGPTHWQSRWEAQHGYQRVEQNDWDAPRRGDWIARLQDVVLQDAERPIVLVAHSLGCIVVAAWAGLSTEARRVRGALLVAPPDLERPDAPAVLHAWPPLPRQRLPFPAIAVISGNDPYAEAARSRGLAADWGAQVVDAGQAGHINADSHLGDWPQGHRLLQEWLS